MMYARIRRTKRNGLSTLCMGATVFWLAGCSSVNRDNAKMLVDVARGLGANVRVRGQLGPARFGHLFEADLGARVSIEGETNTSAVTSQDLLQLNRDLVELVRSLSRAGNPPANAPDEHTVLDDTIDTLSQ